MLAASSCVKNGMDPCGSYLRIVYDYNMEYVDQFHKQVTFFSLFVFDAETGLFVREEKVAQNPFSEGYVMEIPEDMQGKNYTFVVWAGLDAGSYSFPALVPGSSTIDDLKVQVKGYQDQLVDRGVELEPLWHGMLENVVYPIDRVETKTISLMKDTKKFRLVIQYLNTDEQVDINNFDVKITSPDGWYDHTNSLLDSPNTPISYLPYYTANDSEVGGIVELNSLRLMNDGRPNRLVITDNTTGGNILNISLDSYLNALKLLQFISMPLQEYLDREDHYGILIFLQWDGAQNGWMAAKVFINDWQIRLQDIENP